MKKASIRLFLVSIAAGALGGVFSFFLILRLNPQISPTAIHLLAGFSLWMSWGALILGVPLWLLSYLSRRFFARRGASIADAGALLLFLVCFSSALLFWFNAIIHPEFVSRTIQRQLRQDAVVWLISSFLLVLCWRVWRRRGRKRRSGSLLLVLLFFLPVVRLWDVPPQARVQPRFLEHPLTGSPHSLLVCGIEGLDLGFLSGFASSTSLSALPYLQRTGAFGVLRAFRPYLRPALWTTVVTGTLPRQHSITSAFVWRVPGLDGQDIRLLPWTPNGSRLFLPWGVGRREPSPPAASPALWQLLSGREQEAIVLSWPGFPPQKIPGLDPDPEPELEASREELGQFLETCFPGNAKAILSEVNVDIQRVGEAEAALRLHRVPVFLRLGSLAVGRRFLEPHGPGQARRREALSLLFRFLDTAVGRLLDAAGEGTPAVLLSPYGMAPPNSYEGLKRLLGSGNRWRASAEASPDGLLMLRAPGILPGREFSRVRMEDMAPTLCYLLKLPIPQQMEGRVVLEAIDPGWASAHPLRVIGLSNPTDEARAQRP